MKKSIIVIGLLVFGLIQVSDAQRTEQRVRTEAHQGLDNANTKDQRVRKHENGRKKAWRKKNMDRKRNHVQQGQRFNSKQKLQGRKKNMKRSHAQNSARNRNLAKPQVRGNKGRVF